MIMNKDPLEIKSKFEDNYSILNEDSVIEFNKQCKQGDLNNVVAGIADHCFGLALKDDHTDKNYILFYCDGKKELEAHLLEISIDNPDRDSLTFFFSNYLTLLYSELDALDNFNTFQSQLRSCYEMLDYFTIVPDISKKYGGNPNPIIFAPGKKGIIKVRFFDKTEFYKEFFGKKEVLNLKESEKYIYLMLNKRNNHFKIGSSKNLFHREKTLQSEEPEVELITFWHGPVSLEAKLHRQFKEKRQRGEWFDLTLKDLKVLKEQLENLNEFLNSY